jgi:hypothetical protein
MKNKLLLITMIFVVTIQVVNAQLPSYVPTNSLVGYYPFNGNANDVSANSANGVVTGATLINDRFGNINSAYYFNGNNNFISINPPNSISYINGLTISLWVKITETVNNTSAFFVSKGDDNTSGHFHLGFNQQSLTTLNGQRFQGALNFNSNSVYSNSYSIPQAIWHHVVMVHDSSTLKIYVDGILKNTAVNNDIIANLSSNILFGKHSNPFYNYYTKGNLDDIGIWNRALTISEVTSLYYAENTCQSLVINTGVLGFNPLVYNNTVTIYPNPANDHITIDCGNLANVNGWTIKIVNTLGQDVFNSLMNSQQFVVPLNSWGGQGIYILKIYDASNNLINTKKIILQ